MTQAVTKPESQTGAGLLVKSLEAQGVEYIFGIPGAKIDKVFDTLLDSKIKTVKYAGTNKTRHSSPAVSGA
jgi:acetolactate synthase-1/2/3 large subunit